MGVVGVKKLPQLGLVACVLVVAACSGTNLGGETTCGNFNKMDTTDQTAAVTEMLKQQKGGKEPSNLNVGATRLSAQAFCKTLGRDSSKIKDIDTG